MAASRPCPGRTTLAGPLAQAPRQPLHRPSSQPHSTLTGTTGAHDRAVATGLSQGGLRGVSRAGVRAEVHLAFSHSVFHSSRVLLRRRQQSLRHTTFCSSQKFGMQCYASVRASSAALPPTGRPVQARSRSGLQRLLLPTSRPCAQPCCTAAAAGRPPAASSP